MANNYNVDAVTFRYGVLVEFLAQKLERYRVLGEEYSEQGEAYKDAYMSGAEHAVLRIMEDLGYVAEAVGDHGDEYYPGVRIGF